MNGLEKYKCLDYTSIGAQVISPDFKYLFLNKALLDELGMVADDIVGYSMQEKYPDIERTDVFQKIEHCLNTGKEQSLVNEFVYPDKRRAFYNVLIQKVPEGVMIFTTDISESKEGEKLLQESNEILEEKVLQKTQELNEKNRIEKEKNRRLEELQERLNVLLENVPGAFFQYTVRTDGTDKIDLASAGVTDLWELSPEQIGENTQPLWDLVIATEHDALVASINESAEKEERWEHEWQTSTPSGKKKWIRGIGTPKKDEDGNIVWNSFFTDVSLLKEQHDLIARMQRMDNIGHLSAGISHDINNILAIISGHTDVLQLKADDQAIIKHLKSISNAVERASKLTKNLLFSSRKSVSGNEPQVDIQDAINESKALLKEITPANIEVLWPSASVKGLPVDRHEFQDVLNNLYVNAINSFEESGQIEINLFARDTFKTTDESFVFIAPQEATGYAELRVTDNGCGIEKDALENIFIPYVSYSKKKKGSGLGLSMVAGYALRNEIGVSIETQPDMGTTVSLWFPLREATSRSITEVDGETLDKDKLNIVLVDDEEDVLEITSEMLQLDGHNVITFSNGGKALEWLQKNHGEIDLVISDLVMPGKVQGQHIYQELEHKVPFILISGYHEVPFIQDKHIEILKKPFTINALKEKIQGTFKNSSTS